MNGFRVFCGGELVARVGPSLASAEGFALDVARERQADVEIVDDDHGVVVRRLTYRGGSFYAVLVEQLALP